MNLRLGILWFGVTAVALAVVTPAWMGERAAARDASAAVNVAAEVESLSRQASELESELPAWAARRAKASTDETVAQSFARVVSDAGLPTSALGSISPASATPLGSANLPEASRPLRIQHTAVLESITLVQLGRVLDKWRGSHPAWTVTAIGLTAGKAEPGSKAARKGGVLRATLTLETVQPGTSSNSP